MRARPRSLVRISSGIAIWVLAALGVAAVARARGDELRVPAVRVARYAVKSPRRVDLRVEAAWDEKLAMFVQPMPGDPLVWDRDRSYVGSIEDVRSDPASVVTPSFFVRAALDPELDAAGFDHAEYRFGISSGDARWVLETLLPDEKRRRVKAELGAFLESHREEIAEIIRPIGEEVLAYTVSVLDSNIAVAMKKHEKEFQALADRHRGSLKDDLLPVLKAQLGPSMKEKARPILTKIGRECWDALPVWDLGWSAVKDKLPWQSRSYVDEWWRDFLENKAIPIVKQHEPELVKAGEELLQEGMRDPKVRAAFSAMTKKLVQDPDFRRLVRAVLEEALVRPFDAQALFRKIMDDPAHKARLALLEREAAPTLQRCAKLITLDENERGLSPDLARVLRRVVFRKDQRWIAVTTRGPIARLTPNPKRG